MKKAAGYKAPQKQWSWFGKKGRKKSTAHKIATFKTISLSPEGHHKDVVWPTVSGATKAVVERAELHFKPWNYQRNLGHVDKKATNSNNAIDIDLKKDHTLKLLNIGALKSGDISLANQSDLSAQSWRLICSAKINGSWLPVYSVPQVEKRGAVPAMLGGASYTSRLLRLPGTITARRWRLEVVNGSNIETFSPLPISSGTIGATVLQAPENLKVIGPDNQNLWSQDGTWQGTNARVSLRVPLEHALQKQLDEKANSLAVSYQFTADTHGKIQLRPPTIHGALIRERSGVWEHQLEGEATPLHFDPILASQTPNAVSADLTLTYLGIRMLRFGPGHLPQHSQNSKVVGSIIQDQGMILSLPPQVFNSEGTFLAPARLGLFGRGVGNCELVARFRDGKTKKHLGSPATLSVEPNHQFHTHWLKFPQTTFQAEGLELELLTTKGKFYWVGSKVNDLKLAVYDPTPGNRPLYLNATMIARLNEEKFHQPAVSLPRNAFRGQAPKLASDLFLKVELTDLLMRYVQ